MALQDRPDYSELVHGFRPEWVYEIRGYKQEHDLLESFRTSFENWHETDPKVDLPDSYYDRNSGFSIVELDEDGEHWVADL